MRAVLVLIFAVITVCQAQLLVDTPINVVTCRYTLLTWSGGADHDMYTVVVEAPNTNASVLNLKTLYWNWFVTFPPDTQAYVEVLPLMESNPHVTKSGVFTVQAGDDQTCVVYPPNSINNPVNSTPDPASTTSTPANSSTSTSTSSVSSGSIPGTSGLSTSQNNSTSTLIPLPLLSLTGTGTSSDPTGVSVPLLGETSPPSSSPNVGVIAAAAGSVSVALILLLLGICLYRRRRKRPAEVEQFRLIETKGEEIQPFTRHQPTYDLTTRMVKLPPSTNSHEPPALTSQRLHSERRMTSGTAIPLTTPGHNIAVALATPAPDTTTTPSHNLAIPPAPAPSHDTTSSTATSEYIGDLPPIYRDEAEALIQSQRIRAEEAERVRRYDEMMAAFCSSNRDLISPALEHKLRAARHLPGDNPSDLTADYWLTAYGVEPLELRRLQAAYGRSVSIVNEPA